MCRALLGRVLVLAGGSAALGGLGGLADPRWGAAVTVALLATGSAALFDWYRRRRTVLALSPGAVTVGRWRLAWSAVSRIVVYDLAGASTLLGVRLRSPADLPADVPPAQLDQSDPARPVLLAAVAVDRARLDELAAAFHDLAPTADLVRQTGAAVTTLVAARTERRSEGAGGPRRG